MSFAQMGFLGGQLMTAINTVEKIEVKCQPARLDQLHKFDLPTIAELSDEDIRGLMSKSDLIQVIRSVEYPFAGKERLEFFDRDTLERVVCLVRRWSCRQLGRQTL
jgi:hypothetical protein